MSNNKVSFELEYMNNKYNTVNFFGKDLGPCAKGILRRLSDNLYSNTKYHCTMVLSPAYDGKQHINIVDVPALDELFLSTLEGKLRSLTHFQDVPNQFEGYQDDIIKKMSRVWLLIHPDSNYLPKDKITVAKNGNVKFSTFAFYCLLLKHSADIHFLYDSGKTGKPVLKVKIGEGTYISGEAKVKSAVRKYFGDIYSNINVHSIGACMNEAIGAMHYKWLLDNDPNYI